MNIYTPRSAVDMMLSTPTERNKSTCTKIPYKGYEISIAMDSSHGAGDLARTDIRVYDPDDTDITKEIYSEATDIDGRTVDIWGTAENLIKAFQRIDSLLGNAK